jgi:hypothetical protein
MIDNEESQSPEPQDSDEDSQEELEAAEAARQRAIESQQAEVVLFPEEEVDD